MELPREPTALPQARRYNRKFHAQQGKAFLQQEKVTIQIPRINHTYLTKDVKLHFDFDLSYLEASSNTWENVASDLIGSFPTPATNIDGLNHVTNFFSRDNDGVLITDNYRPINSYSKPIPTFDINGPYGLISRIQVYDYLGTTLLEDIPSHEVLTAQFADVWFTEENVDIHRPRMVDETRREVRKQPCSTIFPSSYDPYLAPISVSRFEPIGGWTLTGTNKAYPAIGGKTTLGSPLSFSSPLSINGTNNVFIINDGFDANITFVMPQPQSFSNIDDLVNYLNGFFETPYGIRFYATNDSRLAIWKDSGIYTPYIVATSGGSTANATFGFPVTQTFFSQDVNTQIRILQGTKVTTATIPTGFYETTVRLANAVSNALPPDFTVVAVGNYIQIRHNRTFTLDDFLDGSTINQTLGFSLGGATAVQSPITGYDIISAPVKVPTLHCQVDLFSFLGRFSDKFVPLHNGFQLVLTLSDFTDAVVFNTPFGDNSLHYRRYGKYKFVKTTDGDYDGLNDDRIVDGTNDTLILQTSLDKTNPIKIINIPHATYSPTTLSNKITQLLSPFIVASFQPDGLSDDGWFTLSSTGDFKIFSTSTLTSLLGLDSELQNLESISDVDYMGYTTLDSSITSAKISSVYLDTDLLEITPDLDGQVDKMVYAQAWKYQKDFFPYQDFTTANVSDGNRHPFVKRIIPDLKSITKVFVGQRPVIYPKSKGRQQLGFRIKNYTDSGRLLYNKTEVCSIHGAHEAYTKFKSALGKGLDDYLTMDDFETEEETAFGTNGNQLNILPEDRTTSFLVNIGDLPYATTGWWPGLSGISQDASGNQTRFVQLLSTLFQGRFLLAFDTRIPGATANSIAGIDTTKSVLEYEIRSNSDTCWKVNIDVFVEHDSFIFVDPGKSTSVSF